MVVLASGIDEVNVEKRLHSSYVAECLDLLMSHGTDRYGKVQKPLLVTILLRSLLPRVTPGRVGPWRGQWRKCFWKPRGLDLLVDQSTVEASTSWRNSVGKTSMPSLPTVISAPLELTDEKGFFWWGWHRFYDVFDDVPSGSDGTITKSTFISPVESPVVDRRAATQRELEAIWQRHVIDKSTGEHNRTANGQRRCDFAMSGGEFVYALYFCRRRRVSPSVQCAELVADYHWRSPTGDGTGSQPAERWRHAVRRLALRRSISGLLCYYLLKTYEITGEKRFRDQALTYLRAYAKHGYDSASARFWVASPGRHAGARPA